MGCDRHGVRLEVPMPTIAVGPAFRIATLVPLLALAVGMPAAEQPGGQGAPAEKATPAGDAVSPDQLLKQLPSVPSIVQKDNQVLWDDGKGTAFRFAPIDFKDRPLLETDIGPLPVTRKLLEDNRVDALAALPALVARAKQAGLDGGKLLLADSILAGVHLRPSDAQGDAIVLPEGALRKATPPAVDRAALKTRVADAALALGKLLPQTPLDELGRKTVVDMLLRMGWGDDHKIDMDEVAPAFARRVVRMGWLTECAGFGPKQKEQVDALMAAIVESERFAPTTLFEGSVDGKPLRLAEVKNAFGQGGWILSTPARCAFTRQHPAPMYHWSVPDLNLVVDLPPGSDPLALPVSPIAARLYHGGQAIATWSAKDGFSAKVDEWRKAVPTRGKANIGRNVVTDFVPPSMVLTGLNGDQTAIVCEGGVLAAPKDKSPEEAERFLAQAAQMLPDAAHLDLIGEYLFMYVYDSPDSRFPWLIANKNDKGDIHQTAAQTISSVTAGMMRGDCDDLAELYQTIAERQGRIAYEISLPEHAACAWAEKKEDGQWHVYILQTGPALEFADRELPHALEKAYKSFDDSETFDPNSLGLSLRFSGENTRSQWRLSWRIFAEREYARTMIDVQKDWHFQTYQRGISKMQALIKGGDDDNANYRELAGLYTYTGQYDLAAEFHRKAIERTPDAESKLFLRVELIGALVEGDKLDEARKETAVILDQELPALREKLGPTEIQVGFELASALDKKLPDVAEKVIKSTMLEKMSKIIERIGGWLEGPEFNQDAWDNSSQFLEYRRLSQLYTAIAIDTLKQAPPDSLPRDETLRDIAQSVQQWLNQIAFRDLEEPDQAMMRYASAGDYYGAILGVDRFTALLESAAPPKSDQYNHQQRVGGLAQLNLDLPWIRISVPYWFGRLTELFDKDHKTIDRKEVARLGGLEGGHLFEAYQIGGKLDIDHPVIESDYHLGRLVSALIAGSDPALDEKGRKPFADVVRERLHFVAEKNDKLLRDDTAQWLGDAARFLPMEWYKEVMGIWKDELNYKPKYYWIAWRAALSGAPKHALMVAEMAATEFKDDPSFTEEYEFMKAVLEPKEKDAVEAP
jgi:hypothetical protein